MRLIEVHSDPAVQTAPQDYQAGDKIEVQVNSLSPMLKSNIVSLSTLQNYGIRSLINICAIEITHQP
jgi:hypothetical protein